MAKEGGGGGEVWLHAVLLYRRMSARVVALAGTAVQGCALLRLGGGVGGYERLAGAGKPELRRDVATLTFRPVGGGAQAAWPVRLARLSTRGCTLHVEVGGSSAAAVGCAAAAAPSQHVRPQRRAAATWQGHASDPEGIGIDETPRKKNYLAIPPFPERIRK